MHHPHKVHDRGYLLGEGLFETCLVEAGDIQHLCAHLTRLKQGADHLGIAWPSVDIASLCHQVITANHLLTTTCALRITLTQTSTQRGLISTSSAPDVVISAYPYTPPELDHTITGCTTTPYCINDRSPLCAFKTSNYLESIQAKRHARQNGFDEALLFNTQDRLCCTTIGNVFLYRNQELLTPCTQEGALPGVIRQQLLTHTATTNLRIRTTSITRHDCLEADALFHTNSLIGIQSFSSIDGRQLQRLPSEIENTLRQHLLLKHRITRNMVSTHR